MAQKVSEHLTWHELLNKPGKTPEERILVQCVATLASHPHYRECTPDEIYEKQIEFAQGLYYE